MDLFQYGSTRLHSGDTTNLLIDCCAISDSSLDAIALALSRKYSWDKVVGVPNGGNRFAAALSKYTCGWRQDGVLWIIDDVLTTGASMEEMRTVMKPTTTRGLVLFARGPCPEWVNSIFYLSPYAHKAFNQRSSP